MNVVGKVVIVTLNETKNAKNLIREVSWVFSRQQKKTPSHLFDSNWDVCSKKSLTNAQRSWRKVLFFNDNIFSQKFVQLVTLTDRVHLQKHYFNANALELGITSSTPLSSYELICPLKYVNTELEKNAKDFEYENKKLFSTTFTASLHLVIKLIFHFGLAN